LLVQRVAALVDAGRHAVEHVVERVVVGDAHVGAVEVRGERMLGEAEGQAGLVEADGAGEVPGEGLLVGGGHQRVSAVLVGLGRVAEFGNGVDERGHGGSDLRKEAVAHLHGAAALPAVEPHVIGIDVGIDADGLLLEHGEDAIEVRRKRGKVVVGLGGAPHGEGLGGEALVVGRKLGGDVGVLGAGAGKAAQLGGVQVVELVGATLELGYKLGRLGAGNKLMLGGAQNRLRSPGRRGAGGGRAGLGVVVHQGKRQLKGGSAALEVIERGNELGGGQGGGRCAGRAKRAGHRGGLLSIAARKRGI
jgi:hypothetical protein